MYYNGWGMDKNYKNAFKYYKLAFDNGVTESGISLGIMYFIGQGCKDGRGPL